MKDIEGWLTPHEGAFLSRATGIIVEIGSFQGKSTIHLAQSGEKIYAIDPHKGDISGGKTTPTLRAFKKNIAEAKLDAKVVVIVKTSKDAAKGWKKPVTFLFIDGLHDAGHALEDFLLWSPHVIGGGMIAMHDAFCGWQGAGDVAMRYIVYGKNYKEIGVVGSIIYGVKGKSSLCNYLNIIRNQLCIELSQIIYRASWIPKRVAFRLKRKKALLALNV